MLKFSLSQEDLEKAFKGDLLLHLMAPDQWFKLAARGADSPTREPMPGHAKPIDWDQWPRSESRDS